MRLSRPLQNKAPPHIEGELLKQKDRAVIGRKKGWKKYLLVMSEYCVCELLVVCYYNVHLQCVLTQRSYHCLTQWVVLQLALMVDYITKC